MRTRTFKIPFKPGTKEYQKALYHCHKHNTRDYSKVSFLCGDDSIVFSSANQPVKSNLPHWKEIIRNTVNPPHTLRLHGSEHA